MTFNYKMHERNIYRNRPDFNQIGKDYPQFRKYVIPNARGKVSIDFSNTDALRMLTEILLKKDFNLDVEIPQGFLIPTIPQRLNYILWVEDLLSGISKLQNISGIDIGTGACAIFSLLGAKKNCWNFIATESSDDAMEWAKKNIEKNNLISKISVMKVSKGSALSEVLSGNQTCYEFCLCNPPFFENADEIRIKNQHSSETIADVAQKEEIFVKGGELDFVKNILKDSLVYKDRICLFTSMFGKKKSLLEIVKEIKEIEGVKVTTTEFCQGNTVRWGVAWTFHKSIQFEEVKKEKPKKAKPALQFEISPPSIAHFNLEKLLKKAKHILKELEIPVTTTKSSRTFAELLLKSDINTWTNQRRKRRELERQKKEAEISKKSILPDSIISSDESISLLKQTAISGENPDTFSTDNIIGGNISSALKDCSILKNTQECAESEAAVEHSSCSIEVQIPKDNKMNQSVNISSKNGYENHELVLNQDASDSPSEPTDKSDVSQSKKRKNDSNNKQPPIPKKAKVDIESSGCISTEQGTVLHCDLQLIKGKNKIYVKMNCPSTADRNTMYQVFQIIKNKLM